jgi:hypothetical protein
MRAISSRRERLPDRRRSEIFEFECASLRYTATIGRFATVVSRNLPLDTNRTAAPTLPREMQRS